MKVFYYNETIGDTFTITRDITNHRFVLSSNGKVIHSDILEWWHAEEKDDFIYIIEDENLVRFSLTNYTSKIVIKAGEFNTPKGLAIMNCLSMKSHNSSQKRFAISKNNNLYLFRDIISHNWSIVINSPMASFRTYKKQISEYYFFTIGDRLFGAFTINNSFVVNEFRKVCVNKMFSIVFRNDMPEFSIELELDNKIYALSTENILPVEIPKERNISTKTLSVKNSEDEIIYNIHNQELYVASYTVFS